MSMNSAPGQASEPEGFRSAAPGDYKPELDHSFEEEYGKKPYEMDPYVNALYDDLRSRFVGMRVEHGGKHIFGVKTEEEMADLEGKKDTIQDQVYRFSEIDPVFIKECIETALHRGVHATPLEDDLNRDIETKES